MTRKEERILKKMYPGRDEFSPAEVEFARRAIAIANADSVRSRMPRRDIRVGERFFRGDIEYECVLRPEVDVQDACSGCDYIGPNGACDAPRCSKFDRSDSQFVWFKRVDL